VACKKRLSAFPDLNLDTSQAAGMGEAKKHTMVLVKRPWAVYRHATFF
jgi:hypothetical protein